MVLRCDHHPYTVNSFISSVFFHVRRVHCSNLTYYFGMLKIVSLVLEPLLMISKAIWNPLADASVRGGRGLARAAILMQSANAISSAERTERGIRLDVLL